MAGSSVSVIHGGHGTIYDVIGAGRPALVTPNNAEQKGNGRLLESLGMALVLEPSSSAGDLNAALDRLRFDPAFTQAARRAQQRIKDTDGLKNLALMIESGVM
jgi:UDP:flavonoid glycosyltransferase YjiC (YdhE family)